VFVSGKPFQPSLMFVGKVGAYPSEAPITSLLRKSINYNHKKFKIQVTIFIVVIRKKIRMLRLVEGVVTFT
jgi:hypothetical protein